METATGLKQPQHDHRSAGDQDQRIPDSRPAEHDRHRKRHVPARPGPVEDHQGDQYRNARADMVRRGDQDVDPLGELRDEHDSDGNQHPRQGSSPGGRALGQHRNQQDHQGVSDRGGHMHDVRVQAADHLHEHVFGQLGRVERHVRQRPAME
jgi:hypothetical protein